MTWQRIDEHTYIDDTLVTCAEYQLFIDEMRDQGKYFQPDHWTSLQFPAGTAREPIMGVRYSDAVAFCDWLTKRENEKWRFRLPTPREAKETVLKIVTAHLFGYWVLEIDASRFVWASLVPKNARNLSRIKIYEIDRHFDDAYDHKSNTVKPMVAAERTQAIFKYYDGVMNIPLDFRTDRVKGINLTNAIEELYSYLYSMHDDPKKLRLLIDLIALQERIAGRSPAFEGIRLVKERK